MVTPDEMHLKLLKLPADERARIAHLLLISLDSQCDDEVDESWRIEADKRFKDYKNGLVEPLDGTDVMNDVRKSIR